jgi:hypothetical protein
MEPEISPKQLKKPEFRRYAEDEILEPKEPEHTAEAYPHEFLFIVNRRLLKSILHGAEHNNVKLLWDK